MKLLIIIPAYNERAMINRVIAGIPKKIKYFTQLRILVIDDGSLDGTSRQITDHRVAILKHLINRGLGATLATGFQYAIKYAYDVVVTFDADGQHDPADLSKIIDPIVMEKADIIIGTRSVGSNNMPYIRRIINYFSNLTTFLLFNVWTSDSQSGLRAFSAKAIKKMKIRSQRMEVSSEIFKEISRLHLQLQEVPIHCIYTDYSLTKGQRLSNAPNVFFKLLMQRFS